MTMDTHAAAGLGAKILTLLIMIPCLAVVAADTPLNEGEAMLQPLNARAMTFNIRNGHGKDGDNGWQYRKDFVADVMLDYSPDIVGLQEAYRFQLDHLAKRLPEYAEVGIGRDGGTRGEYSAILYRTKRFAVQESGTFWLSDTPTKPSTSWGHRYRRICTWARLRDKTLDRSIYVFNTHMDHQSQRARENGARLIMTRIQERKHGDPFILMGDLNAGEDNPVVALLKGTDDASTGSTIGLVDSWRVMYPHEKVAGTGSRFSGYTAGDKIDYIFVTPDTQILGAAIDRRHRDGRYPSDHYPVTAQLRFPPRTASPRVPWAESERAIE